MKKIIFISFLFCFGMTNLFSQVGEQLAPMTLNPIQAGDFSHRASRHSAQTIVTDTISLPSTGILDDFSYDDHRPDTLLWDNGPGVYSISQQLGSGVFINRTWAIAPINLGVCTFDGLDYKGEPYNALASVNSHGPADELVSRPIDLSTYTPADSLYLSFWYEAQGRGYAPNAPDSLVLAFNSPNWPLDSTSSLRWENIWYSEGYTPTSTDTNFHLVMIKITDTAFFHKGFRFRFHNWASVCGSNDHWHIDDVYLKSNRTINDTIPGDVGFVYPPSSGLKDFWSVPHSHYKPTMMAPNYNVTMRNNDVVARNITYWYYNYDQMHNQVYQYPNASGAVYNNFPTYWSSGYGNLASVTNPSTTGYSFPQGDTGTYEVKHVLKENATTKDSVTTEQRFYNYYAYDDGSAEVGYGLSGQYSQLAYKFTLPVGVTDTLKAVQMYFLPVQNTTFLTPLDWTLTVWGDQGNQPGTIIYSEQHDHVDYNYETPDRFVSYGIDSGTVVLSGTFYVGWQQLGPDRLYIGFDFNDDHHDKIYYNTSGNWYTSIFNGSLMMRPVFADSLGGYYDASGIHENSSAGNFSIYPNPANDVVNISQINSSDKNLYVKVLDLSGREVLNEKLNQNGTLNISALVTGIYLLQLRNEKGELIGTEKLVKSE